MVLARTAEGSERHAFSVVAGHFGGSVVRRWWMQ